jgi:ribosome recycling factor
MDFDSDIKKAIDHLQLHLRKLQIGRASTTLVEDLVVNAYSMQQPLKALATITVPDAVTIQISPWDQTVLVHIEKSLQESHLGLTPNNDGHTIRLNIPAPTEERRKELTKVVHAKGEDAKISIRNIRHAAIDDIKKKKDAKEISEDKFSFDEQEIQKSVDAANKQVDDIVKVKDSEIMSV